MRRYTLLGVSLLVVGCSSAEPVVTDRYVPFDAAAVTAAQTKIAALDTFKETLESKDFAAIKTAYESSFQADLKALGAAHAYVAEGAGLGVALDQQVQAAIADGAASSDVKIKEAAEEIVQTIISRYQFETIYNELKKNTKVGWDRAFAYYGRSPDGKTSAGIAGMAEERDTEFALKKNDAAYRAFIDGRNAFAQGDLTLAATKVAAVDLTITEIFALSVHHEFAEAAEAIEMNMPVDAIEGFAVGKGLVAILRDYIKTKPNGAATVATIDAELAKGDPNNVQSMSQVAFTSLIATVDTTFGFTF